MSHPDGSAWRARDERSVYESDAQCISVCAALPAGLAKETTGDSLACRRWRAYAALLDPQTQCTSAGPLADGPGGNPCESSCGLLEQGCAAEYQSRYGGDVTRCRTDCAAAPFDEGYAVAQGGQRGSLQCRTLNLSRALAGEPAACASAVGLAECEEDR